MMGNKTRYLLECLKLYYFAENFIGKSFSVKCYDKSKIFAFTLSIWENIRWGLIYFDQFISNYKFTLFGAYVKSRSIS